MRVLAACSLGGSGHLQPLLPFLAAATQREDEVLVVGPPALEAMVGRAGYAFRAGGEPPESEVAAIREQLPRVLPEEASRLGNRELFGRLATRAMLPVMETTCRNWRPDLVLREPCEYASAVAAPLAGIPVAQVAVSTAAVEQGSITMAGPVLEEHRRGLLDELGSAPYLTRFPASLDPSGFTSTVRYRDASPESRPVPDWWGSRSGPLIYVTFGTVLGYMSIAAGIFRAVLDAVSVISGSRVLLTVGTHFDPALIGPTPDNVHIEPWLDQAVVLGQADLVVCHGGSGTVLGAFGAGVPVVAVPVFADQFENANLVVGTRAGMVVRCGPRATGGSEPGIADDDVPRITEAAEAVLRDHVYRAGAGRLAAEMAEQPPAPDVLAELLRAS